jgi:purine-binding chemotaxis protein CheW
VSRFSEQLDRFFYRPDEELPPGLELPEPQDLPAGREAAAKEHLCFRLEQESYAIPIERVREVGRVPPLTEVPRAADHLLGVMNLRGEVLPVYDLKVRLRLTPEPPNVAGPYADRASLPRSSRVVVIRSEKGDAGILVDAVQDVLKLSQPEIEPPPRGTAERDGILGLGRKGAKMCILLDVDQVLA